MNEPNLFVLVIQSEGALLGHWSFRAADELTVARQLLQNAWDYQDVFWALRISTEVVQYLGPVELLQAIRDSYPNPHVRAVLYLLPISPVVDCDAAESRRSVPEGAKTE
jgi:hypothetical protein